jgi:FkbM family methyltransferase
MMRVASRVVEPQVASALTKYLYLTQALAAAQIELVLDVGANVGQFAQALRAIGYTSRIISFEPQEEPFRVLARAAAADPAWEARNMALGDASESRELGIAHSTVFSSFHVPAATQPLAHFSQDNVIERHQVVDVGRLDTVVDELSLRALLPRTLLKCDTQGHDRAVLEGMRYIAEVALLQVELSVVPLYDGTPTMPEMIAYLDALGFRPIVVSPVNRAPDGTAIELDYLAINSRGPALMQRPRLR